MFELWILFIFLHSFYHFCLVGFILLYNFLKFICIIYYWNRILHVLITFDQLITYEFPTNLPKLIKHTNRILSNNVPHVWWQLLFSLDSQIIIVYFGQLSKWQVIFCRQKLSIFKISSFWKLFKISFKFLSSIIKNAFNIEYVLWVLLKII